MSEPRLIYSFVKIWGTAASSLVVISDTGSRKIACLDPIKPIVEFLEVVVPVTYGVFSLASGIWHIVNISLGTETNVSCLLYRTR